MREHTPTEEKVLFWVGSSAADLARFPPDVQDEHRQLSRRRVYVARIPEEVEEGYCDIKERCRLDKEEIGSR